MKKIKIIPFFLLLVLITPIIVVSVTQLSPLEKPYVLCDANNEEEQKEEKETNSKELVDGIKEFILHNHRSLIHLNGKSLLFFIFNKKTIVISQDVSTPPPEIS